MTDPSRPRIDPVPTTDDPPSLNIFRTLAHNRPLLKGFLSLGAKLLTDGTLPAREREIVILRAGWRCGSEYEFGQHTTIGLNAGLTAAEIDRLADAGSGEWSDEDAALISMVDDLCDDDAVSEPTWTRLAARWSEPELIELVLLAGYYRLVSGFLNSAQVALEPGTPGWPSAAQPRRRAPREQGA
jgi:alkylhydroperoxidase family enzyme